jgi:shikimate kinase
MNIILCGHTFTGKTTIAQAYSKKHGSSYADIDEMIIDKLSTTNPFQDIYQIRTLIGEEAFRDFEMTLIQALEPHPNRIIATGGGSLNRQENINKLKTLGKLVYIENDKTTLYNRIMPQKPFPSNTVIKNRSQHIKDYLEKNHTLYSSLADIIINIKDKSIDDIVSLLHNTWRAHG